jgi:uncharacterized membrane protein YecN with MAPEG domain
VDIPVTLLYGGLNGLVVTLLGVNVSRMRGTAVGIDAQLPEALRRPVRAHGNAAEWVPIGLVLLLVLEASGAGNRFWLHLLGGTFFLGRVLHAAGALGRNPLQAAGAALTYLVLLTMGVWAVAWRFIHFGP